MTLITHPNTADADGFCAALLAAHQGLTTAESHAMKARLVLVLANHVGDRVMLDQTLNLAKGPASHP